MIARRLLLTAPALLSVASCAGAPAPAVVELSIRASTDVNPNPAGTPVSVAVRLYWLIGRGRFMSADAYALMDREKATLGDESAGSEEIVLRPGEVRSLTLSPKPGVRYLGVAVLFREIDRAQWRAIAPIAAIGLTRLALTIGRNRAVLESA
jgi:type VI secretion system protein VasD